MCRVSFFFGFKLCNVSTLIKAYFVSVEYLIELHICLWLRVHITFDISYVNHPYICLSGPPLTLISPDNWSSTVLNLSELFSLTLRPPTFVHTTYLHTYYTITVVLPTQLINAHLKF